MMGQSCLAYWKKDTVFIYTKPAEILPESTAQTYRAGFLLTAYLALPHTWLPRLIRALEQHDRQTLEELEADAAAHGAVLIHRLLVDEWLNTTQDYIRSQFSENYTSAHYFYHRLLAWHQTQHSKEKASIRAFPDGLERYLRRQLRTRQFFTQNGTEERLCTGYQLDRLEDLLHLDSLALWANEVDIVSCAHCDRFFINPPKTNFKYCDWPSENETTCRSHGPMIQHKQAVESDPVLRTYRRMYRKHYARHERSLSRDGRMEQSVSELLAFKDWSREAQSIRQRYLRQELDRTECLKRLNHLDQMSSVSDPSALADAPDTNP